MKRIAGDMKRMAVLAALAAFFCSAAWAQAVKPAAKAASKPSVEAPKPAAEAAKPVAKEASKGAMQHAAAKPADAAARKSRRHEDARHCLDQPSNSAIIKCAEEYL